jgi:hypothetical protein
MNLADARFVLPSQITIVEWGSGTANAAAPAPLEVFESGWFDTWRLTFEDVQQPKAGNVVNTGDPTLIAPSGIRPSSLFWLDVFIRHSNLGGLPLKVHIDQIPAPALMEAGFTPAIPRLSFVASSLPGVEADLRPVNLFSRRFLVTGRMVRIGFQYPNSALQASAWMFCAQLRSG